MHLIVLPHPDGSFVGRGACTVAGALVTAFLNSLCSGPALLYTCSPVEGMKI